MSNTVLYIIIYLLVGYIIDSNLSKKGPNLWSTLLWPLLFIGMIVIVLFVIPRSLKTGESVESIMAELNNKTK